MSDEEYDDEYDDDYDEESEEESESPSEKLEMTYHAIRQLRKTGTSDKMLEMMGYSPEDIVNAFKEPEEEEEDDAYDAEAEYQRELEERRQLLEEERMEQERERQRQQQLEAEAQERKRQYILGEQKRLEEAEKAKHEEEEERKRQFMQQELRNGDDTTTNNAAATTPLTEHEEAAATNNGSLTNDGPKFQRRLGRRRTQEHQLGPNASISKFAEHTFPGVPVKAYYHFQEQDLHHMELKLSGSTNIKELTNLLMDNQALKEGVQKLTMYVEETFTFFQAEDYLPLFQAISGLPAVQNLYLHYFGPLEKFPMTDFQDALKKKKNDAASNDSEEPEKPIEKMETNTVKLTGKVKELDMRRQWIDTLNSVSSDLSCIYYFMRRNPLLCDINYINGVKGYDPYELDDEQVAGVEGG